MTQAQVAVRCGLTFQQIQKYEAGIVAISVARLVVLAHVLEAPLSHFLDGLPSTVRASPPAASVVAEAPLGPAPGLEMEDA